MTEPAPAAAPVAPVTPAAPTSSAEAGARLANLAADPAWGAKILANSPAEVRQMHDLIAVKNSRPLDPNIDRAMAEEIEPQPFAVTAEGGLSLQNLASSVVDLRAAGLSDGAIKEAISGATPTKQEQDAARRLYADKIADTAAGGWVSRLLKGGAVEKRELLLMQIVIGAPVKKETAS